MPLCGFYPTYYDLYDSDPELVFTYMDKVINEAEKNGIGIIASLMWWDPAIAAHVGEKRAYMGIEGSKTLEYAKNYTAAIVQRYADHPAIWGWEIGNEYNLNADLCDKNLKDFLWYQNAPGMTYDNIDGYDYYTSAELNCFYTEIAKVIRRYDDYRMISTGNSEMRPFARALWEGSQKINSKHLWNLKWDTDTYEEFVKMREEDAEKSPEIQASTLFTIAGISALHKHFKHRVKRLSVKTKFTFVITGLIIVILLAFMLLILNTYKKMFIEAVSDVGRAQAEQTAAVYDSADGRNDKISAFFEELRVSNDYAETPFERIDIIVTYDKEPVVYLETWEPNTELPNFNTFAYTTGKPKTIDEEEKSLTSEQAVDYLKRYKSEAYKKDYVYSKTNKTCKYIYPVTFSRKAGKKLTGFAIVTYKQQVLMRQYFRTKVFVFTLISIFLYLSVIFSILLADFIFNPLLFLRKNVKKTSRAIEKILGGTAKNASNTLKFYDTIKTKDEIKDLSLEIGEMVGLIKGIMPYVSFSTLQHAEKVSDSDGKKSNSTTSRDLCFLFTDIRGFTSLCEGMPPKKVVEILNRYLEIETQIILDNNGDIDKFVGDEMMAFFSGPRKEINACKAAMEIRAAMREQQQISMEDGSTYVSIGIGINSGKVTFGPVGSRARKDFTSIGDAVNLAARLEGANKAYGSKSIITETVYQKLRDMFICRELDFITVKGKTEPVRIYEILQQKTQAKQKRKALKFFHISPSISCRRTCPAVKNRV